MTANNQLSPDAIAIRHNFVTNLNLFKDGAASLEAIWEYHFLFLTGKTVTFIPVVVPPDWSPEDENFLMDSVAMHFKTLATEYKQNICDLGSAWTQYIEYWSWRRLSLEPQTNAEARNRKAIQDFYISQMRRIMYGKACPGETMWEEFTQFLHNKGYNIAPML